MSGVAKKNTKVWDVVVIGGGPAGMMAAGTAAERGLSVLLLEKNEGLGKKLLITGGGRCNVTNAEPDTRVLLKRYKGSDKFLFSAFSRFGVEQTLSFFHERGMPTKIEAEGRVFPKSDTARSVWDVLVDYMKKGHVTIRCSSPVASVTKKGSVITAAVLEDGTEIAGKAFVLATGGKSRPETGSTGEGFKWLAKIGHRVDDSTPALVPIVTAEPWVKKLQGMTFPKVKITLLEDGEKRLKANGKILFTHFGVSGPTILNLSSAIGEALRYSTVSLLLDLFPDTGPDMLNERLRTSLRKESNRKLKNMLSELVPAGSVPVLCGLAKADPETFCHSVTREMRLRLCGIMKALPLTVKGLLGTGKAVVTKGGVALEEVDFKTMRSRLFPNLYLIGDVLDIDRPSGGYSLQLCWTTGRIAGLSVGEKG